ncbi:hypothetical protein QR680_009403 [Steinernema hermaphroditum]|uniref:Group XV phospholipase A2 n=1 Tax=Steinernema hermaphroditum TaxID=289476 RepID=A0AA39IK37_9BILA|nr:hypothetical protein QR680_009403 [Steinernema hermaphroditum]
MFEAIDGHEQPEETAGSHRRPPAVSSGCSWPSMASVLPSEAQFYEARKEDPTTPGFPVVLVPGDGGSQIEANLTGKPAVVHYSWYKTTSAFFDLWLDLTEFAPLAIDCWADNMRLEFDAASGVSADSPGIETRIPGFGGTASVEWLDKSKAHQGQYFAKIADALAQWGYTRGKDLIGAPFDWRRAPHELHGFFAMLRSTIETAYFYNGNREVVVLAHSMGNPTMLYFYRNFVSPEWKEKFVQSHVSLAGAWAGAMQIVKLFASGYKWTTTDYQPTTVFGDGDGTVNLRSLELCRRWNPASNAGKTVTSYAFDGADHMGILADARTVDLLRSLLYRN